jgi:hypothetical protein
MAKQWTLEKFRKERDSLGRLAASYVDAVRAVTGWPPLQLRSLYAAASVPSHRELAPKLALAGYGPG